MSVFNSLTVRGSLDHSLQIARFGIMMITGGILMLYWALIFFIVALVAALFGFTGIAAGAAMVARFLFFIFVVLLVLALIFHFLGVPFPPGGGGV